MQGDLVPAFAQASAVIFIVNIAEYVRFLPTDECPGPLEKDLALFESKCNSPHFSESAILLLFRNTDEFKNRIATTPLERYLPEFLGELDDTTASDCILGKFVAANKHEHKPIYTHFASETETGTALISFLVEALSNFQSQGHFHLMTKRTRKFILC